MIFRALRRIVRKKSAILKSFYWTKVKRWTGGKRRAWTLVHAGAVTELMLMAAALEERATEYQALKKSLLESLDIQRKLSEQNELFQKMIRRLSDQLEARAQVLVEEEKELEEMLLKMEGQHEKEVKEKQEKKKKRFWRFWKWKHESMLHTWSLMTMKTC